MQAVWSLWSKPMLLGDERWQTRRHHLLSWVVSVNVAKRHYAKTSIVTDREGATLLVDQLQLPFETVDTSLDGVADEHPRIWALGKLVAYSLQRQPFVHLDSDVYLWRELPGELATSPIFAQNAEDDLWRRGYDPDAVESRIANVPAPWNHSRESGSGNWAPCCGILGGTNTSLIRAYAESALQWIRVSGSNSWAELETVTEPCIHIEQYYLACFADYHRAKFTFLFKKPDDSYDLSIARRYGYTHLIGGAKKNPEVLARLEARVKRDWPEYYERVNAICPE